VSIRLGPFVEEVPVPLPAPEPSRQGPNRPDKEDDMTQYLLSVWHDDPSTYDMDVESPDAKRLFAQVDAVNAELQAAGAWVFAGGLHAPTSATVVRSTKGEVSMTDGPYAESKEQMGGFWVIEAADLDAALEWAGKAAAACEGPVEVRPFQGE
jgi:hypothetical protein